MVLLRRRIALDEQPQIAELSLGLPRELASQQRPPVGVLVHAGRLRGQRLLPCVPERRHAHDVAAEERDPEGDPRVVRRPVGQNPHEPRHRGDRDEPLAADELLRSDAARDVDEPAPRGRPDDREEDASEHRDPAGDALLGADDRIPGERERRHELEDPFAEELALRVGDRVAEQSECERQRDVRGIRQCRRHLAEHQVAGDAATEPGQERHEQDPHDREVLEVVGTPREQRAVERVRRGGDEIDERVVPREIPALEERNVAGLGDELRKNHGCASGASSRSPSHRVRQPDDAALSASTTGASPALDMAGKASTSSATPSMKLRACSGKPVLRFGGGIFSPNTRSCGSPCFT